MEYDYNLGKSSVPFLLSPPDPVGGGVGPPPSGLLLAKHGVKAENNLLSEVISTRKKLSFLADKIAPPFLLVTMKSETLLRLLSCPNRDIVLNNKWVLEF